jgi:hypothetical protein
MSDDSSNTPPVKTAQTSKHSAWGIPAAVIIALVAMIATQWVAAIVVSLFPVAAGWDAARAEDWFYNSPAATFFMVLLFETLAVATVALFVSWRHVSFWVATALKRIRWRDWGYAAGGFVVYFAIAAIVLTILPILVPIDTGQEQNIGFEPGIGGTALLMAFIGLVVLPPIVEEIVFRGFLFGTLRSHHVHFAWSAIATSLLFGSLHLMGGVEGGLLWIGLADTFVLSLVLCYVREATGSLWASIIIHALKNGLVFLNIFVINAT